MAYFFEEPSHTFDEYLLIPGYTGPDCIPANVNLQTPVVRYNKKAGEKCPACGTELQCVKLGGRSSVFCPRCQR